jgi:prepilin-type N-terminal cleavage/methylation domain-containing protein
MIGKHRYASAETARRGASQRGLTLVEIITTLALLVVLMGAAIPALLANMNAQRSLAVSEELEEKVRRAGEELRHELGKAGASTLVNLYEAPKTVRGFRFRPFEGFDAEKQVAQWGSEVTIASSRGTVVRFLNGRARGIASGLSDVQFAREGRVLKIYLVATGGGNAETRVTVRRTIDVALQN